MSDIHCELKKMSERSLETIPDPSAKPVLSTLRTYAPAGMFVLLGIAALHFSAALIIPVFAALVVGSMTGPLIDALRERSIHPVITALLLLTAVLALFYLLLVFLSAPVAGWITRAPEIGDMLRQKLAFLERPTAALRNLRDAVTGKDDTAISVGVKQDMLQTAIGLITPAVSQLLLFAGTLFFFMADRRRIKQRIAASFPNREARLKALHIFSDAEDALRRYMLLVTAINLGLGLATTVAMFLLGVPSFYLWGLLAFILNYIPYLGPAIVASVLFIVGVISFPTLQQAMLPAAVFVGIATIEGHFLTPSLIGRHLTLRPFVIFLSLAFWTWLWGPAGAFLAAPLLIVVLVVLGEIEPADEPRLPG